VSKTIRQALAPHLHEIKAGHVDKIVEAITQAMLDMPELQDDDYDHTHECSNPALCSFCTFVRGGNESKQRIRTAIKLRGGEK